MKAPGPNNPPGLVQKGSCQELKEAGKNIPHPPGDPALPVPALEQVESLSCRPSGRKSISSGAGCALLLQDPGPCRAPATSFQPPSPAQRGKRHLFQRAMAQEGNFISGPTGRGHHFPAGLGMFLKQELVSPELPVAFASRRMPRRDLLQPTDTRAQR